jgi:hypothetical protein
VSQHHHILRRLQENKKKEPDNVARVRKAVEELRASAEGLPLQAQLDICSAIFTIEEALCASE